METPKKELPTQKFIMYTDSEGNSHLVKTHDFYLDDYRKRKNTITVHISSNNTPKTQ